VRLFWEAGDGVTIGDVATLGGLVTVLVSVTAAVASALELTKSGRLRNQLTKELSIRDALDASRSRDGLNELIEIRAAVLAWRNHQATRPWMQRRHPIVLTGGYAAFVLCILGWPFALAGHLSRLSQNAKDLWFQCLVLLTLVTVYAIFLTVFRSWLLTINREALAKRGFLTRFSGTGYLAACVLANELDDRLLAAGLQPGPWSLEQLQAPTQANVAPRKDQIDVVPEPQDARRTRFHRYKRGG
jgi:hypothetical protein